MMFLRVFGAVLLLGACSWGWADQADDVARGQKLADYLSGKKFVGRFTVDGKNGDPKVEEYEIRSCEKLDAADMYRMTTRIKYGDIDQEVPLEVKILFAGNTPVITLDAIWIPGLGTFDARVMIRRDRYSGTWQHDANGGHLYGYIQPIENAVDSQAGEAEESAAQ